ncbi:MAG: hypothetical protein JKX76_02970 [Colwellia sp.]|nr:hypothetical protein [Colwellia sp.]
MTTGFALEYIKRRMLELGFGDRFLLKYRHLQLQAREVRTIDANNQFYLLIEPDDTIAVSSKFGQYNISDRGINEMQYEHRGTIKVSNISEGYAYAKFIQVIPKHK